MKNINLPNSYCLLVPGSGMPVFSLSIPSLSAERKGTGYMTDSPSGGVPTKPHLHVGHSEIQVSSLDLIHSSAVV